MFSHLHNHKDSINSLSFLKFSDGCISIYKIISDQPKHLQYSHMKHMCSHSANYIIDD